MSTTPNFPLNDEFKRFEEHLKPVFNERIFFSGIFGIGKTYFLKEFFKQQTQYEQILLCPVNYSIAPTHDIINYIKFDIIFDLLEKPIEFENISIPDGISSYFFLKENYLQLSKVLIHMSGQIGKSLVNIIDGILQIDSLIEKHKEKYNTDQIEKLMDFLNKIKSKEGSIYEQDLITDLLSILIQNLKFQEDKEKETVLVIDDLDRMDPEHIFRILNVFACHLDFDSNLPNKFGFDKVILVGDIENIRNIFKAKYGIDTDYNGYIDKFFSSEIYDFNNISVIHSYIPEYLSRLKVGNTLKLDLDVHNDSSRFLIYLLNSLISHKLLSTRNIINSQNKNHNLSTRTKFISPDDYKKPSNLPIMYIFKLLISIYGSSTAVKENLTKLMEWTSPTQENKKQYFIEMLVYFLDFENHQQQLEIHIFKSEFLNLEIKYSVNFQKGNSSLKNASIQTVNFIKNEGSKIPVIHFEKLLLISFEKYLSFNPNLN